MKRDSNKQYHNEGDEAEVLTPTPGTMKGDLKYHHKTFGVVNFSRTQTSRTNLFGSSVQHSHTILMTIQRADYNRSSLGYDSYYGQEQLISIEMSPNQFANAITNMNSGGVPCTIKYIGGEYMGAVPKLDDKKTQATNEFKEAQQEFVARFTDKINRVEELIAKGRAGKGELKEISDLLGFFKAELTQNQPFHMNQFIKGMDTVVNEAKAEIEAYVISTIHNKGIQAINQEGGFSLPEGTNEKNVIHIGE